MNIIEYAGLMFMAVIFTIILVNVDMVQTIVDDASMNLGEVQIGIFILLGALSTIGFIATYKR